MRVVIKYFACDAGVTAIEYALIGGLIAVVIVGAVTIVGQRVLSQYDSVATGLS